MNKNDVVVITVNDGVIRMVTITHDTGLAESQHKTIPAEAIGAAHEIHDSEGDYEVIVRKRRKSGGSK